ncbi:EamA family transporter [Candidatus Woesearchaeota archaeon]|nr:EamA family transporter [Candidatus Woesearchaeota archaeon]
METTWWGFGLIVVSTIFGAIGSLYLKLGAQNVQLKLKVLMQNTKLILGFFFFGIATAFFILGLKGGPLSVLYPVTSLTYIWIVILSLIYLKERLNIYRWLGIISIIIGVILIGVQG